MIFVAVGKDDRFDERAVLLEVGDVGNDQVDSQKLGFGNIIPASMTMMLSPSPQRHHVHSEFAETAQGMAVRELRGVTQRMVISIYSTLIVSHADRAGERSAVVESRSAEPDVGGPFRYRYRIASG